MLLYRGYPIEQLAEHGDFLEACYLLLYGELPTAAQKADFDDRVTHHTMVHEQMSRFFQGFRRDAHPMAVMVGCVGALSAFYHDSTDITDPTQRMIASIRMIAKMPTLAAMAYKYSIGQPFIYPKNDLDYASNFLRMCFAVPCEEYKPNPVLARAHGPHLHPACRPRAERLDLDGAACRLVRRQPVRLHRRRHRLPVGPGAWRRQRGGAEDARRDRHASTASRNIVKRAKDKNDPFRLMGFGHRVYKNYDPRAKIMQKTCHEVLDELGVRTIRCSRSPWSSSASRCRTTTSSRRSSIRTSTSIRASRCEAMGFPTAMFTVLFALARTVGWIAQWKEMIEDPHQKIGRPRQLYTGAPRRDYQPISRRK